MEGLSSLSYYLTDLFLIMHVQWIPKIIIYFGHVQGKLEKSWWGKKVKKVSHL